MTDLTLPRIKDLWDALTHCKKQQNACFVDAIDHGDELIDTLRELACLGDGIKRIDYIAAIRWVTGSTAADRVKSFTTPEEYRDWIVTRDHIWSLADEIETMVDNRSDFDILQGKWGEMEALFDSPAMVLRQYRGSRGDWPVGVRS
jgi:hypothetical protein